MHVIVALCATENGMRDVIRWSLASPAYIFRRHLLVNVAPVLFFSMVCDRISAQMVELKAFRLVQLGSYPIPTASRSVAIDPATCTAVMCE